LGRARLEARMAGAGEMSKEPLALDDDAPIDRSNEIRDIVLKSGFSGVAATVLTVVMCSPAGFGGMIRTSLASLGLLPGNPNQANADDRSYPRATPLTQAELVTIRERLESSSASIDNMRAATDAEIEFMRGIAEHSGTSHAPSNVIAAEGSHM